MCVTFLFQISFFEIELGVLYFAVFNILFIVLLFINNTYKLNFLIFLIILSGLVSILFNEISPLFQPYQRFIAFIVVVGLIGPLISNTALKKFRIEVFWIVNNLILIMVALSFIGLIFDASIMINRSGFTGLFNHSMILGPMALIATLTAFYHAQSTQSKKLRLFFFGLAIISIITCLAAGSRAALLAGVASIMFYYYKLSHGKITRFLKVIFFISLLAIISFPFWKHYTERLISKFAYAEQNEDLLITRASLWEMRIIEFNSSPLIGIGFASVNTSLLHSRIDSEYGKIEPGSSWLVILSMLGVLGFIPFLILLLKYFLFLLNKGRNQLSDILLGSLLVFYLIHMFAEGYVLSAGAGLFFYFWLLIGNIDISFDNG